MRTGKNLVVCPKCKKLGFLSRRWVRGGSWQPTTSSKKCIALEQALEKLAKRPHDTMLLRLIRNLGEFVSGTRYRSELERNSPDVYKVRGQKTYHHYIGHYNAEVYAKRKRDYDNGDRKSKPDGRTWCYIKDAKVLMLKDKFFIT